MSSPLRRITPDLLDDLQDVFILVEVTIKSQSDVRLKVKLPPYAQPDSDERKALARDYNQILRKHGIHLTEKPRVIEGVTGCLVSTSITLADVADPEPKEKDNHE